VRFESFFVEGLSFELEIEEGSFHVTGTLHNGVFLAFIYVRSIGIF